MLNISENGLVDALPPLHGRLVLAAGAAVQLAQLMELVLHDDSDVLPVIRIVSLLQPLVHLHRGHQNKAKHTYCEKQLENIHERPNNHPPPQKNKKAYFYR
jgi:hypothetical protein